MSRATASRRELRRETRHPHYVRRRVGVFSLLALIVALGIYLPATLLAPVPTAAGAVTAYTAPTQASTPLELPSYGSSGIEAVGYPTSLATGGSAAPRSIASISKIITALVVLQKKPLDGGNGPKITFTAADHALYATYLAQDGEVAPMNVGDSLTEKQVLQVALIKSANNYAGTLALWAFGTNTAYQAAVKTFLAAHGLTHTTIVEPTGLDARNTSIPTDLIVLGKLALASKDIAPIVDTKQISIPNVGVVQNSNELLGIDDVVGIKTGTLDDHGSNLLFATKQTVDGHAVTLIGAVLGGKDHDTIDADIQRMLAQVTARFHTVDAVAAGSVYGTYATPWGATVQASTTTSVSRLVYGDVTVSGTVHLDRVGLDKAGHRVGSLEVHIGASTTTVPLVLDKAVAAPDAWWRLTNPKVTIGGYSADASAAVSRLGAFASSM
ncbi:D-alanyl-D-alanine carboxypeptidase family protein [Frondihabitans sp. PAMC 28766]|uniref:D-alanyl-D-alanine carboxypeptidase family protein n=1 Tax=Frondihabitans sp. PAMC 28766 TaxID=1795630 RepID=UPI0012FF7D6F|nr:D-alanyl-D-alanine carboxypeptidase [Frondihabitans sp. PAMC 28766]